MPVMNFSADNKRKTFTDFEKLKLELGETARISLANQQPYMEWVHTLRKPEIIDGQVVTEKVKKFNSEVFEDKIKHQFVSRLVCTGNPDVLAAQGMDPDNCPVCKAHAENPSWFDRPSRRFAMNVLKYHTRKDGKMQDLYHGIMLVWAFTDRMFGRLIDMQEEGADFKLHDLVLGPCEPPVHFQKFDIKQSNRAEWNATADTREITEKIWETAYSEEVLQSACGRAKDANYIALDIRDVIETYRVAEGLAEVVPDDPEEIAPALAEALEGVDLGTASSLVNADGTPVEEPTLFEPPAEAPAAEEAEEVAEAEDAPIDINALLNQING